MYPLDPDEHTERRLEEFRQAWRTQVMAPILAYVEEYLKMLSGGYGPVWLVVGWLLFGIFVSWLAVSMMMDIAGMT